MSLQARAQADYAAAFRALMPGGRVWPNDPDSVQSAVIFGLCGSFASLDVGALDLLVDSFPATSVDLLPEWESSLGLPDPCVGDGATTAQRQAQVVARLIAGGGQSAAYFTAFAAALGFTIEIVTYAPARAHIATAGSPACGPIWAFAWGVDVTANTSGLAESVLLCELNTIKPAEATVFLLD